MRARRPEVETEIAGSPALRAVPSLAFLPRGLSFDRPVPSGGYAWWYLDAISDDGNEALTLIAFIGSVFSPYYAWSGRATPENHVAVNVALYRRAQGRWAMTERGQRELSRTSDSLQIGPTSLHTRGDELQIEVNEQGWPIPRKVKGRVRVIPEVRGAKELILSPEGAHHWWPIAPKTRVEVDFGEPGVRWSGTGYLDANWGSSPIESAFRSWTWSRAPLKNGAVVLYDVLPRQGGHGVDHPEAAERRTMALRFDGSGVATPIESPPPVRLPRTLFALPRQTRSEGEAAVVKTLTDAHFYARSLVQTQICGEKVLGVHESLSLDRLDTWWARLLLPFRMPRQAR